MLLPLRTSILLLVAAPSLLFPTASARLQVRSYNSFGNRRSEYSPNNGKGGKNNSPHGRAPHHQRHATPHQQGAVHSSYKGGKGAQNDGGDYRKGGKGGKDRDVPFRPPQYNSQRPQHHQRMQRNSINRFTAALSPQKRGNNQGETAFFPEKAREEKAERADVPGTSAVTVSEEKKKPEANWGDRDSSAESEVGGADQSRNLDLDQGESMDEVQQARCGEEKRDTEEAECVNAGEEDDEEETSAAVVNTPAVAPLSVSPSQFMFEELFDFDEIVLKNVGYAPDVNSTTKFFQNMALSWRAYLIYVGQGQVGRGLGNCPTVVFGDVALLGDSNTGENVVLEFPSGDSDDGESKRLVMELDGAPFKAPEQATSSPRNRRTLYEAVENTLYLDARNPASGRGMVLVFCRSDDVEQDVGIVRNVIAGVDYGCVSRFFEFLVWESLHLSLVQTINLFFKKSTNRS